MASSDPERGRANARWANIASDDNYASRVDSKWTPWLIPVFVVANVAVFIVVMYFNNCPANNQDLNGNCLAGFLSRFSFQPLRENPLFGPSSATLEKLGALQRYKVVQKHQGWRLVSCIWLNAGFIHLLLNMLSLVIIGVRLEQQFGFVRVGILYLVSGFGGSILSSLFIQNYVTVGASGGLFGLLGATLSELMTSQAAYSHKTAALFTVIVIAAINLAVGIFPHVNNFASIGGFITGLLLGFALLLRAQHGWVESKQYLPPGAQVQSKYKLYQYVLCLVSLLLLIAGFAVGLVMLFKGKIGNKHQLGNKHCSWCHYLSCVPTSKWNCDS